MRIYVAGNPVGEVKQVLAVDNLVKSLTDKWAVENPTPKWWQVWKKGTALYKIVNFIFNAVDDLIVAVEKELANGPEKKAVVLAACCVIYDFIVANALPLWIKPWAGKIRVFVIYTLIATAIDFLVEKYRSGAWSPLPAPVEEPNAQKEG
jgi:hypothetical protein